jgi:hypothetical protein
LTGRRTVALFVETLTALQDPAFAVSVNGAHGEGARNPAPIHVSSDNRGHITVEAPADVYQHVHETLRRAVNGAPQGLNDALSIVYRVRETFPVAEQHRAHPVANPAVAAVALAPADELEESQLVAQSVGVGE